MLPLGCIATELPVEPHSPMLSVAIARTLGTGFLAYLSEFTCAFLNCFGVSNFSERNTTPKLNLVPPVHLHCGVVNSHDDIDWEQNAMHVERLLSFTDVDPITKLSNTP